MKEILRAVKDGSIDIDEAEKLLNRRTLEADSHTVLDIWRRSRYAVPEIVLADTKSEDELLSIASKLAGAGEPVIMTRLDGERARKLAEEVGWPDHYNVHYNPKARVLRATPPSPGSGVRVGIITAGTSDIPVAEEAREVCHALGVEVHTAYDVGAAGIHRLYGPLLEMLEKRPHALIVCAGREGVLPTIVSGLVDIPVIGVPVGVGYGHMGNGESALASMLQSCSPIAVVNIDAGAVAAVLAFKIGSMANTENGGMDNGEE